MLNSQLFLLLTININGLGVMKLIQWIVSIKFGIEMKTFFVSLTQSDHQRVYPGGVNEQISENL